MHVRFMLPRDCRRVGAATVPFALVASLVACGGGGGGSGSGSNTTTGSGSSSSSVSSSSASSSSVSAAPVLSASPTSVSATVDPSASQPSLAVNLSIAHPPSSGTYYSVSQLGTAVATADIQWSDQLVNGAQSGSLDLTLYPPAFIGSGTYHDTVTVQVCSDSQCANPLNGSPVTIAVTYTVTGNAVSDATYQLMPPSISVEVPSTATAAPTGTMNFTANEVPPYGAYIFISHQSGGAVASVSFQQTSASPEPYAYGTGVLTATMETPASLGPGFYSDVLQVSICYDTACTKPAVGTPFIVPVTYTVTASAGREFQEQIIDQNFADLAVDPAGSTLYAVTVASSTASPQLLQINPASGAVTTLLTLPAPINQLLVSPDGQYLYLVAQYSPESAVQPATQVLRVPIASMTIDQTVPITTLLAAGAQIAVSPASSTTWALASEPQADVFSVQIFDGSVPRPNVWSVTSDVAEFNQALWTPDASTLYVLDANLDAVAVTPTGLGSGTLLQNGTSGQSGFDFGGNLQLVNGLLYSNGAEVLDPGTNTILGQYPIPSGDGEGQLAIDPVNNRTFASYQANLTTGLTGTIESFDLTQFTPIWIARLPSGTRPLRWGSDGLAWVAPSPTTQFSYAVYLINGTFVAPSAQQPASTPSASKRVHVQALTPRVMVGKLAGPAH